MQNDQLYFITQANLRKLVRLANVADEGLAALYEEVFGALRLNEYISGREIEDFDRLSLFLAQSDDYLAKLATEINARRKQLGGRSQFLFVSGAPSYHAHSECETLRSDYVNFEIPDEIRSRGQAAVKRAREFALQNRKLLGEGREDVFLMRFRTEFKLTEPLGKVTFVNSGCATAPTFGCGASLENLELLIGQAVDSLEELRNEEGSRRAFANCIYAPAHRLLARKDLPPYVREVLLRKKHLITVVTEYLLRKQNRCGSYFSRELLDAFGFKPCAVCTHAQGLERIETSGYVEQNARHRLSKVELRAP